MNHMNDENSINIQSVDTLTNNILQSGSGSRTILEDPDDQINILNDTSTSSNLKNVLPKAKWTDEEDEILIREVKRANGRNWKLISNSLNKSEVQCLHRWTKVLNPNIIKGSWTDQEDQSLKDAVNRVGIKNWSIIAKSLPGRIGKQCRERWFNHVDPTINKADFTKEEDRIILEAHRNLGNRWVEISKSLEGRSDNAVKNHFHSSLKRRLQKYLRKTYGEERAKEDLEDGHFNYDPDDITLFLQNKPEYSLGKKIIENVEIVNNVTEMNRSNSNEPKKTRKPRQPLSMEHKLLKNIPEQIIIIPTPKVNTVKVDTPKVNTKKTKTSHINNNESKKLPNKFIINKIGLQKIIEEIVMSQPSSESSINSYDSIDDNNDMSNMNTTTNPNKKIRSDTIVEKMVLLKNSSKNMKSNKNRKKTRDDYCFCCDDGGRLIECSKCPKVYHNLCLGYKKTPREKEWICPCHKCLTCDKDLDNNNDNTYNDINDNILYRCKYCPYSYCKDCIESVSEKTKFDPLLEKYFLYHNYDKHNFEIPKNIKWIICIECFEENKSNTKKYPRPSSSVIANNQGDVQNKINTLKTECVKLMKLQKNHNIEELRNKFNSNTCVLSEDKAFKFKTTSIDELLMISSKYDSIYNNDISMELLPTTSMMDTCSEILPTTSS